MSEQKTGKTSRRSRRRPQSPHEPRSRARRRAVQALYQWQLNPESASSIVSQFLDEQDFTGVDIEFFRDLILGVENHQDSLDEQLSAYLDRAIVQVDPLELAILRLGALELTQRLEVPVRVVIDEAIELARRFGSEQGHAVVNGVLDKLAHKTRQAEMKPT
ncbi:MAG: transcription antitermination factor NusB [Wenzhouxiangellaceae bacterium]